ncbi:hypothetical protein Bca52824_071529 [Brassica carinata]|uniref:Major facilitator superfamily protein n=1 Tax=Brassica carinata TaxID=52824 RepID=A0A8X7U337_BRACI|nr:hypothetical protein Bca52824_071529 [Brassica carinata]
MVMMDDGFVGMRHMLTIVFLSGFAGFMEGPVITDVTVAAVCSSPDDACSLAVYLTGFQQVAIGLGTMVMMPVIGNLSDRYGIKAVLTLPMCLSILPPVILGYRRDTHFFYMFYIIKILTALVCEGAVDCLASAYVAENIQGRTRISAFSILAGVKTMSSLCGTLVARFLPVALIFKVSAISFLVAMVYMRIFLKERLNDDENGYHQQDDGDSNDVTIIFRSVLALTKPVLDLMLLITIVGLSLNCLYCQDLLLPLENVSFYQRGFYGIYKHGRCQHFLGTMGSLSHHFVCTGAMLVMPSVCGIASRQVGPGEQGKVQGCISGVKSFGKVVAPFVFSPLTALFLSNNAPFYFPGFSLLCISLSSMFGFLQSLMIKDVPPSQLNKEINSTSREEV